MSKNVTHLTWLWSHQGEQALPGRKSLHVLRDTWSCGLLAGKGRGRQVIAVARTADMVIMMIDATKKDVQK